MPAFIVRVELIGTPGGDTYTNLHTPMAEQGFQQSAPTLTAGLAQLPHAMYFGNSNATGEAVSMHLRDAIQTKVWTKMRSDVLQLLGEVKEAIHDEIQVFEGMMLECEEDPQAHAALLAVKTKYEASAVEIDIQIKQLE